MRTRVDTFLVWPLRRRRVLTIAAVSLLCACATSGTPRPASVEIQDGGGFTINERARASGNVHALFDKAVQFFAEEEYTRAIPLLVSVTETAPTLTTPHIDLGIAYGRTNDLELAVASIERAVELSPSHPVAHNELGILYRKTGKFDSARESYEKALAVYPDFHFARLNLAILCDVYLRDLDCAIEQYEAYSRAVPDDPSAAMWIADLRNRIENGTGE
jgi:tetratricopeptide (TPR) repeat protein